MASRMVRIGSAVRPHQLTAQNRGRPLGSGLMLRNHLGSVGAIQSGERPLRRIQLAASGFASRATGAISDAVPGVVIAPDHWSQVVPVAAQARFNSACVAVGCCPSRFGAQRMPRCLPTTVRIALLGCCMVVMTWLLVTTGAAMKRRGKLRRSASAIKQPWATPSAADLI